MPKIKITSNKPYNIFAKAGNQSIATVPCKESNSTNMGKRKIKVNKNRPVIKKLYARKTLD